MATSLLDVLDTDTDRTQVQILHPPNNETTPHRSLVSRNASFDRHLVIFAFSNLGVCDCSQQPEIHYSNIDSASPVTTTATNSYPHSNPNYINIWFKV